MYTEVIKLSTLIDNVDNQKTVVFARIADTDKYAYVTVHRESRAKVNITVSVYRYIGGIIVPEKNDNLDYFSYLRVNSVYTTIAIERPNTKDTLCKYHNTRYLSEQSELRKQALKEISQIIHRARIFNAGCLQIKLKFQLELGVMYATFIIKTSILKDIINKSLNCDY